MPRGRGWLRFLLSIKTSATTATAPAADPMTIPIFEPVVRPGASAPSGLEEDEAPLAEDDEVDEPTMAVDDEPSEAVLVAPAVSLALDEVVMN